MSRPLHQRWLIIGGSDLEPAKPMTLRADAFRAALLSAGARGVETQGVPRPRRGKVMRLLQRLTRSWPLSFEEVMDSLRIYCSARRRRFEAIVATSPPLSCAIAGRLLARKGAYLVIDVRDAWATNPYRPRRWPRLAAAVESSVLARADEVLVVAAARTGYIPSSAVRARAVVVRNGVDYKALPEMTRRTDRRPRQTGVHIGRIYGLRAEVLHQYLASESRPRFSFLQIGPPLGHPEIRDIGERPHRDALIWAASADFGVIVSGSVYDAPSKLLEYVLLGLPVLTIGPRPALMNEVPCVELSSCSLTAEAVLTAREEAIELAKGLRQSGAFDRVGLVGQWLSQAPRWHGAREP